MTGKLRKSLVDRAFAAANETISIGTPATDLVDKYGVSRHTIMMARLVVERGTEAELLAATSVSSGIQVIAAGIKARMTPEERLTFKKRNGGYTESRRENHKLDAKMWAKLSRALDGLTSLPLPKDVVDMVHRNHARVDTVNNAVVTASNWMEEFAHEWARHQSGQSEPTEGSADAGNGDSASGTQHTKSAA